MTEMHDVVEMLLSRMRDYPEDFVGDPEGCADIRDVVGNKWKKALRLIGGVVAPHEKEALDIRLEEARRAVYMGAALKTILSDDEPEEHTSPNRITNPWMSTTGLSQAQLIPTSTTTNINLITELEARVKAQEAQMQRQYAMMNANNTAG